MAKVFTITEGLENMGALRTGGQGSVYKARRTGTILSAVKLLPTPIHSESPTDKHYRDFQNEVQKLKKVNEQPNPNVVKILSSGITETGSLPFIEMEFIEGPDLEELLKPPHDPIFTIKETVKIAEQLSGALAHCHKVDVKHGDVKSNNVKFNIHSGNYVLLDFGLAVMSDEERRTSLRRAGAIEFMAPEQNEGQMLFQTDVYSLGIILFELLAGQVPFPLKDQGETARNLIMIAHMEAPPPDLIALRKEHLPETWSEERKEHEMQVPQWLLNMIYKCLEKRPENRFANGMKLHDYVVHNSVRSADRIEKTSERLAVLEQENRKLLQEKEQLQQQLLRYTQGNRSAPQNTGYVPQKKSSQSVIIAFIITAAVVGAIVYFALRSNNTKLAANDTQGDTASVIKPKQLIGQFKVVAQRAYFHNQPDPSTRRNAFMIPSNDVIAGMDEKNGFIYTEFTNSNGQTSKGWIRKEDLVSLEEWTQNNSVQTQARPAEEDIDSQLRNARTFLDNSQVKEAVYIYSYLASKDVPEAMYEYGNLALQNKTDEIDCKEALRLINTANERGYIPAKRTLGFLYVFAENAEVLKVSNYDRCQYEKDVIKGTQLLIQASALGDSTARHLLEDINSKREEPPQTP
jgi:serine/threonine protein kinase